MTSDGMVVIEDICVGDEVVSTCIDTFEVGVKRVAKTFVRESSWVVHIKVDVDIIHTTTEHPFYVKDIGFVDVGLLRVYDELVDSNENIVIILKLELCEEPVEVYNFEVEEYHTYYVGDVGVWVHNADYESSSRNASGVASGRENLPSPIKLIRGSHGNIGVVPKEVADKMRGREFNTFDDFRRTFWKEYSASSYASEFSKSNVKRMSNGLAPKTLKTQNYGKNTSYVLHHKNPIYNGGRVYDLDNSVVVSPTMHQEILDKGFHFNK